MTSKLLEQFEVEWKKTKDSCALKRYLLKRLFLECHKQQLKPDEEKVQKAMKFLKFESTLHETLDTPEHKASDLSLLTWELQILEEGEKEGFKIWELDVEVPVAEVGRFDETLAQELWPEGFIVVSRVQPSPPHPSGIIKKNNLSYWCGQWILLSLAALPSISEKYSPRLFPLSRNSVVKTLVAL